MAAVDNQEKSRGLSARGEGTANTFLFLCDNGFAWGVLEIQLDNGCLVTSFKEVSPRVPFLGYLKFFR
jgi:hypothetical protein